MMALIGLYFLCINETLTINRGDILTVLCAIAFTIYILFIDKYASKVDGVWFSFTQFATLFVLSTIAMFIFEDIELSAIKSALFSIAYAGILSSGIAYTIQIFAQRHTDPTSASLIMSLESVFALLAGMVFLGQYLHPREIVGCAVMFMAIVLSQIPNKKEVLPK